MISIIITSLGASLLWASRWYHGERLGYVSAQWLSEYRQNQES